MKSAFISQEEFINSFYEFAGDKILCREDIKRIIELSFQHNKSALENIAFHAKYLSGLLSIIKNKDNSINEEYFSRVKDEYAGHVEEIKKQLTAILEYDSGFFKSIAGKKYFEMTQESLENLNKLCADLARIKSFLNNLQERGKGF